MGIEKSNQAGFSLVEVLLVCSAALVLIAGALPILNSVMARTTADAAAQCIAQEISYARALAVGSNADVLVRIDPNANSLVVAPGSGQARGPFKLGGGMRLLASSPSPDTPDGLGSTVLGIGDYTQMTCVNNGSVVVDSVTNTLCSGTFLIQHSNGDPGTRRAVTLSGGTGRIHIWRYDTATSTWK
jgi:Tfp pilus assembly protein FimT